jgi:DNA replication protein DnaC
VVNREIPVPKPYTPEQAAEASKRYEREQAWLHSLHERERKATGSFQTITPNGAGVPILGGSPDPLGKVLKRSELSALPKVEQLVDGFLSTPATVVLVGGYGVGKTFVAIALSNSTGTGLPWLVENATQCRPRA